MNSKQSISNPAQTGKESRKDMHNEREITSRRAGGASTQEGFAEVQTPVQWHSAGGTARTRSGRSPARFPAAAATKERLSAFLFLGCLCRL